MDSPPGGRSIFIPKETRMYDDYTGPPEGEEISPVPPSDGPIGPGWWQFFGGAWHWMTEPAPKSVSGT